MMKNNITKKLIIILIAFFCIAVGACSDSTPSIDSETSSTSCGTYNGKILYKGPQGGCYYINSNGNKTYVDRSNCRCT